MEYVVDPQAEEQAPTTTNHTHLAVEGRQLPSSLLEAGRRWQLGHVVWDWSH
jgi:hypothetical protein